uniref:Uncharacterized protein n=1 Tax=Romanomermis culicivorax TaxID=13658 RepID=A0A915K0A5_ROMCU
MSCKVTTLACLSCLSRETSRIAVHGAPSSCSSRICFRATRAPVKRDLPLTFGGEPLHGVALVALTKQDARRQ